ncbi:RC-LH1 core complex protein PufX [Roseovarius nanhaiticus]|uniref:RC-LH1 core complex protein PufX n=1 Tax=Roseovarius nanhaiticus TaxID=573024 RepID=UPI0024913371|nr:RC-LH1 core complex protein PufX [Roseovarius nanhaiticus]
MTEQDDYLRTGSRNFRLTADVTALMLKGAGYAALFCFAIFLIGWVFVFVAGLLPEDSKLAPDPTPTSSLVSPEARSLA